MPGGVVQVYSMTAVVSTLRLSRLVIRSWPQHAAYNGAGGWVISHFIRVKRLVKVISCAEMSNK